MIIVWDEPKRVANLAKHGIDFADVTEDFFINALIREARDGRHAAIGRMNGIIVVIFLALGNEGISIVSARRAIQNERKLMQ